jgi:hypothetical protein
MTLPDKLTYSECYDPAMKIQTQAEADEYFEALVERHVRCLGATRAQAVAIERENLGYWAGYQDSATRERVERLFKCAYPVFGPVAVMGQPTVEEALAAGAEMGRRLIGAA